jgi:hypothetical protein
MVEQLSRSRDHSAAPARSFAHGWRHGWRVEFVWQQGHAAPTAEGSWQRSEQQRLGVLSAVGRHRLSETDWVSTVALGRAQFGAQYRFAIIQTLLRFQNTK